MVDLWDLLIIPALLLAGLALVFGLYAFAELWEVKAMMTGKEKNEFTHS